MVILTHCSCSHLVPVCFIHYIMPPGPYLYSKIGVHIFKIGLVVILIVIHSTPI